MAMFRSSAAGYGPSNLRDVEARFNPDKRSAVTCWAARSEPAARRRGVRLRRRAGVVVLVAVTGL